MPYSEPTDMGIVACPGGQAFASEVIVHLKHMYKHRFNLKRDVISKRYNIEKDKLVKDIPAFIHIFATSTHILSSFREQHKKIPDEIRDF